MAAGRSGFNTPAGLTRAWRCPMAKAGDKRIARRRRRQHRVKKTITSPTTYIAVRSGQSDPSVDDFAVKSANGSPTKLTAVGLTVGSPAIGTPAVNHDTLQAADLVVGSPVIGRPALNHDTLQANDLTVGSPEIRYVVELP